MAETFSGLSAVAEARGDWPASQKQLEAWLRYEPKSALAMERMGRCLFQEKHPTEALAWLKEAARGNPKLLTPEAILGGYYQQAGDRENARKWFFAALQAAPKDLNTHLVVSRWGLDTGQLDLAKAQADAATKIDPESLDAMMFSGMAALFAKDYPTAERVFLHGPRPLAEQLCGQQ